MNCLSTIAAHGGQKKPSGWSLGGFNYLIPLTVSCIHSYFMLTATVDDSRVIATAEQSSYPRH